jgi:hypothetical protein
MRVGETKTGIATTTIRFTGALLALTLVTGPARADFGSAIDGVIDVSAVQAEVDDEQRNTVRQRYTVNFAKVFTDYIDARTTFRYFRFDIDEAAAFGSNREELQPSASLAWRHPWFTLSSTGSRRIARLSTIDGDLTTDNLLVDWRTVDPDLPMFNVRYDWRALEDTSDSTARDARDQQLLASVHWNRIRETYYYGFTRRWNENLIRNLDGRENSHVFRYLGTHYLDDLENVLLSSRYLYSRSDRTDEVRTGGAILEALPAGQGLFTVSSAPLAVTLDPVPGLVDGNTGTPTDPPVQIGAGSVDRNVGLDLGFSRRIDGLFVFTDRSSSGSLSWAVYTSEDNVNWRLHEAMPQVRFDTILQRYEIAFPNVETRYVKAVNGGVNQFADVLVTEVQAFEAIQATGDVDRTASSHLVDLNLRWEATRRLDLQFGASARRQPAQGTLSSRNNYDLSAIVRHRTHEDVIQQLRWEETWQDFERSRGDLRNDVLSYTFLYDPLPTLSASTSASARLSSERGRREQENFNWLIEGNASPWRSLTVSTEGGLSRINQLESGLQTDSWTLRSVVDASITKSLNVLFNWSHQQIDSQPDDRLTVRRGYGSAVDLRLTSALFARASLSWVDDTAFSRVQDYLVSWTLGPRLILTGQANINDAAGDFRTMRWSANASVDLGSSATAYLTYLDSDLSESGGQRTVSWQQGIRVGF